MYQRQPTIYIGYDAREHLAFETLVKSIQLTSSVKDLNIIKLDQDALRAAGLYRRAWSISPDNKKQRLISLMVNPFLLTLVLQGF